ncbi:hypothetical protein Pcinc_017576 [Petrolisthes cinctipes]|uniref:Uncharacterized protein n=1 Tax=Petrolisthes cinctipes TaxID=88211 RepID=A0AAE1FPV9_PETCI|nr:hypothetical protein Pcinc_017576 [Petrolisthes cinctipes]
MRELHLNTFFLSFSLQSCGVQFYKRLTNLRCLLATVPSIHPSFLPSTATVQASLVTVCSDKSEDLLNMHQKKKAKEDKQRTEE